MGTPKRPIVTYAVWEKRAAFGFSIKPDKITTITWSVTGTMGVGIFIKAPIAVRAVKREAIISVLVLLRIFITPVNRIFY